MLEFPLMPACMLLHVEVDMPDLRVAMSMQELRMMGTLGV